MVGVGRLAAGSKEGMRGEREGRVETFSDECVVIP